MSLRADVAALQTFLSSVVPDIKWRYLVAEEPDLVIIYGERGSTEYGLPLVTWEVTQAFQFATTVAEFAAKIADHIIEGLDAIDNHSGKTGHEGTAKVGPSQEGLHSSENGGVRREGRTLMELFALDGEAV